MAVNNKHNNECGPFIACGAAAVSLDHTPGEPTSIDNAFAAIKRFFKHERTAPEKPSFSGAEAGQAPIPAHEF